MLFSWLCSSLSFSRLTCFPSALQLWQLPKPWSGSSAPPSSAFSTAFQLSDELSPSPSFILEHTFVPPVRRRWPSYSLQHDVLQQQFCQKHTALISLTLEKACVFPFFCMIAQHCDMMTPEQPVLCKQTKAGVYILTGTRLEPVVLPLVAACFKFYTANMKPFSISQMSF